MSEPFQLTPRIARQLPWLVAVAFFMQALDGTILNTALPSMASSLNENPLRMQAVVIAYLLTVALLIPASGWIADRFGTRRVFLGAVLLFSLGSLLCALSPSLELLVGARIVQGVGGALMMPVGRLVILRVYPRQDLVRVLSFVTIPGLLGPLAGPTLGGWLVEYASWHWIFLINLPVGLLGCLVAMKLMPDLRSPVPSRFDSIGFLLFGGSMVLISIALEGLGELHLSHLRVVLLLIGGLVLLTAYWLRALRIDKPLFPPSLFKARTFAVGILGNLFARLGSGALPFLTPLLLQVGLGYPPSTAGMTMIPLALFAMVAKPMAKPLLDFFGYRKLLVGNTLILGCLIAGFGLVDQDTPLRLAAAAPEPARRGELPAIHGDEHPHPDRPAGQQRQQRQQPDVGGRAVVDQPRRGLRGGVAGRFPDRPGYGAGHRTRRLPRHLCQRRPDVDAGRGDLLPARQRGRSHQPAPGRSGKGPGPLGWPGSLRSSAGLAS